MGEMMCEWGGRAGGRAGGQGYGFVSYDDPAVAQAAIARMNGLMVGPPPPPSAAPSTYSPPSLSGSARARPPCLGADPAPKRRPWAGRASCGARAEAARAGPRPAGGAGRSPRAHSGARWRRRQVDGKRLKVEIKRPKSAGPYG